MSHLLRCVCGGQFVVTPQAQPTGWQCPYCGAVCYAPAVPPAAPPLPPPVAAPLPPPVVPPPPVTIHPDRSRSFEPTFVAPTTRRRPSDYLWPAGIAAAALFMLIVVWNLPAPRKSIANAPRKTTSSAAKSLAPPTTNVAAPLAPAPSDPVEATQDDVMAAEAAEEETPAGTPRSSAVETPDAVPAETHPATAIPAQFVALTRTHCLECHDGAKQEAGLRLDDLAAKPLSETVGGRWRQVLTRLKSEEMPPPETSRLSREERSVWVSWLQSELRTLADRAPRPTVRRLNRAEYMNTMQALIGLPPDPTLVVEDVISTGFDTDAAELNLSPQLMRQYVHLARAAAQELRRKNTRPPGRNLPLFGGTENIKNATEAEDEARRRLQPFAAAAFRRPVDEQKLARLARIVADKVSAGNDFDDGMQLAVQAVLCSPQLLLLTDLDEVSDDYALASKLSYFLWSGPPDAVLLELAEKQTLRSGETLREQTTRMIKDPRSRALADQFGGQWLGTRELGLMQPDEELFPDYTPALEAALREETHRFFDHILRQNLSITAFIDADFTFVNEPLSRLYGIPGVRGNEFRKVSLNPQQHRGGVLTQGTMLSITSDGVRSSPVIRGVWILENILGDPPAPPPADVPDLEADTRGTKTIREELAKHRQIESCNSCHRKIDPLGFALENYDAVGQWRTHYRATEKPADAIPVDNKGELPDGTTLVGVLPLKKALLQRKRDFARCLAEKLLSYACGRKLDYRDEDTVEQIVQTAEAGDYRFQVLIQAVVQSPAFRGK